MRRGSLGFALALLVVVALAACGGGDDDGDATAATTTTGAAQESTTSVSSPGSADLPRWAKVSWNGNEMTFALVMCSAPSGEELLVSGSDDAGKPIVIEVNDGTGEVSVFDPATGDDVVIAALSEYEIDDDGSFSGSGTVSSGGSGTLDLEGKCQSGPG
jgi:hypothetical protein